MKIALVLHLYQPPTQDEAVFRKVFSQCYQPLIKLIKTKKIFSLTLNLPLSLLEQADLYGYGTWLADLKDLYSSDRVEITGSGAYHPLLTKLSQEAAERHVVLNEYGLGYYLGSRTGFEGESAVMTKNISGFFAPECAVNNEVIRMISELGYEWVLVDQTAISGSVAESYAPAYYTLPDLPIKIVPRNKGLSDLVSFYRGSSVNEIAENIFSHGDSQVLAMDGETFGHHSLGGIELLEDLVSVVTQKGGNFVTVRQLLSDMKEVPLINIVESTWGASYEDMGRGDAYPYWSGNDLQKSLYRLEALLSGCVAKTPGNLENHDSFAQPLWFYENLPDMQDETKRYLKSLFHVMKYEHSDKYWWSSKKPILGNPMLYNKHMVESALGFASKAAECCEDASKKDEALKLITDITALLGEISATADESVLS